MGFFSGKTGGSGGGKKTAASDMFKQKMSAKTGGKIQEDYSKMLENRIKSETQDYLASKQRAAKMRGGKDVPQELSKSVKTMLQMLAQQKLQKEMKDQKMQEDALRRAQKKKQQAEETAKRLMQYQNDLKAKQLLVEQEALAAQQDTKSYWFGQSEET